jgi:tetratricopeptide (TPR) repeat protein
MTKKINYMKKAANPSAFHKKKLSDTLQKAVSLHNAGKISEAEYIYKNILEIDPNYTIAHNNLGNILQDKKLFSDAEKCYRRALKINPNNINEYNNLGNVLQKQNKFAEAEKNYHKALKLNSNHINAHCNLGITLLKQGRLAEAEKCYYKALKIDPNKVNAHCNLGITLLKQGRLAEAEKCYYKALEIDPENINANLNESFLQLLKGNFQTGWEKYEFRFQNKELRHYIKLQPTDFSKPQWKGENISGKIILLYWEQGFGDIIQFIRYAPLIADYNAKILLIIPDAIKPLIKNMAGVKKIFKNKKNLPHFDIQCPLMSLPLALKTTIENIPADIPYLFAYPEYINRWKPLIKKQKNRLKVGIFWASRANNYHNKQRNIPLSLFKSLFEVAKIDFISLQKELHKDDAKILQHFNNITNIGKFFKNFGDTAAVISQLDLVITVDTAVAHLAGALGVQTWVMLPFVPDWRWLMDRDDSPWYPTIRLFRQSNMNDWESVTSKVISELKALVSDNIDINSLTIHLTSNNIKLHKSIKTAISHHKAGRLSAAEDIYKKTLNVAPNNFDANYLMGLLAAQRENYDKAMDFFKKALQINPYSANVHSNIGNVLKDQKKLEDAKKSFNKALSFNKNHIQTYCNLGIVLQEQGRFVDAAKCYHRAIEINPDYADAHNNMGNLLREQGRLEEAKKNYRRALEIDPNNVNTHRNLGVLLKGQGLLDEANNSYCRALEIDPNNASTHWNESLLRLLQGNFETGWKKYEHRFQIKTFRNFAKFQPDDFDKPQWMGEDINGKTILIYYEQGFGDAIQFVRYVPLVADCGAKILLIVQSAVKSLFINMPCIENVFTTKNDLPHFDFQSPLMSLPMAFKTTIDTIPANAPYLFADHKAVTHWKIKRTNQKAKLKVGIFWASRTKTYHNKQRNISLSLLKSLFDVPKINFISLQKDLQKGDDKILKSFDNVYNIGENFKDFSDTAAVISQLDLVITVDTAVAHLAGALAIPTWVMLPFVPDWRWLMDRDDSPWYPTIKLFRQTALDDWKSVIFRVAYELKTIAFGDDKDKNFNRVASRQIPLRKAMQMAVTQHKAGRLSAAEDIYKKVLAAAPNNFDANYLMGMLAAKREDYKTAKYFFKKALKINPNNAEVCNKLGMTLQRQGKLNEAEKECRRAIAINNKYADSYVGLGIIMRKQGKLNEAEKSYRKAIEINPHYINAHFNMGNLLQKQGRLDESEKSYRQLLKIDPNYIDAYCNLGFIQIQQKRLLDAEKNFCKALEIDPDHDNTLWNESLLRLLQGNFETGWKKYEHRFQIKEFRNFAKFQPDDFDKPQWRGEDINGKTILIYYEQGFGDVIQFIRYVPLVADYGAKILLIVQSAIKSLFMNIPCVENVFTIKEDLPHFDFQSPLMSLPLAFNTTIDTIPADVPYLFADPECKKNWKTIISNQKGKLKVGIFWSSRAKTYHNKQRNIPLSLLKSLFKTQKINFISLQKDLQKGDAEILKSFDNVYNIGENFKNFNDTAAVISQLDMVIAVDTAVAHLAGALAIPTWVMLPFVPDWRWLLDREDSPWYPTMKLFRQKKLGDWKSVISMAANDLSEFSEDRR